MKTFVRLLPLTFLLFVLACSAAAQSGAGGKVGIINSSLFVDEKTGITKIVTAIKGVDAQFTATRNEINGMRSRLQSLATEIDTLQKSTAPSAQTIQRKVDEAQTLERDLKRKSEDAAALYAARERTALQPIQQALYTALQQFIKTRGYYLVLDIAKDNNGVVIAVAEQGVDITRDFITFFNARP